MDKTHWTEEIEDKLIDLWQENDCLYVVTSGSYRDREKKRKAVAVMAETLGFTGKYTKLQVTADVLH